VGPEVGGCAGAGRRVYDSGSDRDGGEDEGLAVTVAGLLSCWVAKNPLSNSGTQQPSNQRRSRDHAFAAIFVTFPAPLRSPIVQLPWKMAPSSITRAGVSMSL